MSLKNIHLYNYFHISMMYISNEYLHISIYTSVYYLYRLVDVQSDLTHWGRNKMAAIPRTTLWNAFF